MTIIATENGISMYVAITLRAAIKMYAAHRMMVNRAYTPTRMLAKASEITCTKFKRGQFAEAEAALTAWIEKNKEA